MVAMRVICAPDSFKGSLTAGAAAAAMRAGVLDAAPDAGVDLCPIADGGEGTVDAMPAACEAIRLETTVTGPRGDPVKAAWALIEDADDPTGGGPTAVIEMAAASGLILLDDADRDPERTTTFGTGELIAAAIDRGATTVLLGIGGSATCDGGCGAVQALGGRFVDGGGNPIDTPMTGGDLDRVATLDVVPARERLAGVTLRIACDVTNPLTGPDGAARVYGPQKGADADAVDRLDAGLRRLAELWREQLDIDADARPGAGAAGGLGGGLEAMLGATLERGIDLVLDATGFDRRVRGCDLCLTGEGRLDGQSLAGKAVLGVARTAAKHGVPTVALVGRLGEDAERTLDAGLAAFHEIAAGLTDAQAMRRAAELLRDAAADAVRRHATD